MPQKCDDTPLLNWKAPEPPHFLGKTYNPERDGKRLNKQLQAVYDVLKDGKRRTLRQIADEANCPEASGSARIRDLRRLGFPMMKENLGSGTWSYWLSLPA